ncbi:MAG: preprotein translocase subunit YajC [Acidothermus sp.]|nr:preprotein translocase subunit YajC [Acidothermus sp.]MCL6537096.1 preprotein translocase subunit YajC [Acidothermus sp.]
MPQQILFLIIIVAIFYFLLIVPQNRRRKQALALQRSLEPGTRVVTTSGFYGTIVSLDDDSLELEIADGVVVRLMRAAVMRTVDTEPAAAGESFDQSPEARSDASDDVGSPDASAPQQTVSGR